MGLIGESGRREGRKVREDYSSLASVSPRVAKPGADIRNAYRGSSLTVFPPFLLRPLPFTVPSVLILSDCDPTYRGKISSAKFVLP